MYVDLLRSGEDWNERHDGKKGVWCKRYNNRLNLLAVIELGVIVFGDVACDVI